MKPEIPIILFFNNTFSIEENLNKKASYLYTLNNNYNGLTYYKNRLWNYEIEAESKFFSVPVFICKLLNLPLNINFKWMNKSSYELYELKARLIDCTNKDNEVLTKFTTPQNLTKLINECNSYKEIISILRENIFTKH
jgi:hypothetical protein